MGESFEPGTEEALNVSIYSSVGPDVIEKHVEQIGDLTCHLERRAEHRAAEPKLTNRHLSRK